MTDAERKLIRDLRTASASHRVSGERLSAELMLQAANKLERLLGACSTEEVPSSRKRNPRVPLEHEFVDGKCRWCPATEDEQSPPVGDAK